MSDRDRLSELAEASRWHWYPSPLGIQLYGFEWVRFFATIDDDRLRVSAVDPSSVSHQLHVEAESLDEGLESVLAEMEAFDGETSCDFKQLVAEVRARAEEVWR